MSEALAFIPHSVFGYAIATNLLGTHGWIRVRIVAQKTSDNKMLDKIRRCVGQIEKAQKMRMTPKTEASPEAVVPGDLMGLRRVLLWIPWKNKRIYLLFFFKSYTWFKWECLRTGVSLSVLQYPFPKPLLYKQLKEFFSLHQIIITISRQKTRHLKKHGKQEPLCVMPLDEYELMTNTHQSAFEKNRGAERDVQNYLLMFVTYATGIL
jgi:hypothetical protein